MESANSAVRKSQGFGLSFAAGFASFTAQIIFLRELLSLLPSNEVIIALYFTFYLLWSGAGAAILRKIPFRILFLLMAPFFFLSLLVVRLLYVASRPSVGALPSLWFYPVTFLLMAGFSSIGGGFFSSLSRSFGNPALVYGADSLGSFTAAPLLYLALLPHLHSFYAASASFLLFSALIFALGLKREAVASIALCLILPLAESFTWSTIFSPLKVQRVIESPYGKITLTQYKDQQTIWENSEKLYDYPPAPSEKMALLSMVPGGRRVALIGGGGRCIFYLRKIKGLDITYAEPDPALTVFARKFFPMGGVRIYKGDGVGLVRKAEKNYDLLLLDLPPPSSSASMRFYTKEFFREASRHFSRISLSLPGGEYFSDVDSKILSAVYSSIRAAYPFVNFVPGQQILIMASKEKFELNPGAYQEFLREKGIKPEFYFPIQMEFETNALEMDRLRAALHPEKPIQASNPSTYLYSLVKWLRHYFPSFPIPKKTPWLFLPLLLILPGLLLRGDYLMGVVSFSAFSLELLYLLLFQYQHGYIYLQVSLFVGIMMAFLGLGSLYLRKKFSLLILLAMGLLPLIVMEIPGWAFYLIFASIGAGEGGVFGFLADRTSSPPRMFFWDLLGSSLAGFLLGLAYIPIFGFKALFALSLALILLSLF